MTRFVLSISAGLLALALAACGGEAPTPAPAASAVAAAPAADPAVQKLYDATCKACHGVPGTGAPAVGDSAAWAPRVAQGRDALLDHTIGGFQKMPPLGMCPQCGEADFVALIEYMSGTKLE